MIHIEARKPANLKHTINNLCGNYGKDDELISWAYFLDLIRIAEATGGNRPPPPGRAPGICALCLVRALHIRAKHIAKHNERTNYQAAVN